MRTASRSLLVTGLLMFMLAACGTREATVQPAPPQPTTPPPPTQAATVTQAPSPASTVSPSTPTVVPVPTTDGSVLVEEWFVGAYTVRVFQPAPGMGMYNRAIISGPGQPEIQVESATAIGSLPVEDVTGDRFPDLWLETFAGGSRCCWGTIVYSLGPTPVKVLDILQLPDYYGTGSGVFEDLDGDGIYEFVTKDPLLGIPCTAPSVKAVLRYAPGQGYVGAGPRFAGAYADDIAAHTRRAEAEIELSRDGYKCGVYEVIVDYLYAGQPDRAWEELRRLYLGSDLEQFQMQLEQAVLGGRFFVAGE